MRNLIRFQKSAQLDNGLDLAPITLRPIVRPRVLEKLVVRRRKLGNGRLVEIDHGHGFKSRYGHLSGLQYPKGDTVGNW